ncbi:CBS domain-containing protein [Rhodoligotrophos appendicifer]|uniref:CBS domain-containing protein n=1 Tax=Rhodoligotrophos appendicifer TaxID=987056 RepID=UPI0011854E27|nr:CBS domain-containing protein [Rhodoligotrophos appendicifer]
MTVATILKQKGHDVLSVSPDATIHAAARLLAEKRIGALVVVDEHRKVLGIISERDIVRALAGAGPIDLDAQVSSLMSSSVLTCRAEDTVAHLMSMMTENRVRHLPVIGPHGLDGIVSIGDVVKMRIAEAELEAEEMKRYIVS